MKRINIVIGICILTFVFILSIVPAAGAATKPKTIADFETSAFFKKQIMKDKSAWDLRTSGKNNYYAFKDSDNPNSSLGVELTTKGQDVVEIGIHWNGESDYQPAKITPKKMEHLTDLALFWGIGKQAKQIIDYAKSSSPNVIEVAPVKPRERL